VEIFRQGLAPFGFVWSGGKLRLSEAEAAVRREAFELCLAIRFVSGVAKELNRLGRTTRRGSPWSDVQVARILTCASAIGRYEGRRTALDRSGKRKSTTTSERICIECEPLVSVEVWTKVQTLIEARRKAVPSERSSTLANLVACGCGEQMRHDSQSEKFVCPTCRTGIATKELETIFSDDFAHVIESQPSLAALISSPPWGRQEIAVIAQLEAEDEKLRRERQGAEKMFVERAITKTRFEELYAPLEDALAGVQEKLARLRERSGVDLHDPRDWSSFWSDLSSHQRQQIMAASLEKIECGRDEIHFRYLFPDPSGPKDPGIVQQISHPTNQPHPHSSHDGPVYLRLPKPGRTCELTGLTRAKLNDLILPNKRNDFRPPVKSISLRKTGQVRGSRLIVRESLLEYLRAHQAFQA
jgi:hypothetical protein